MKAGTNERHRFEREWIKSFAAGSHMQEEPLIKSQRVNYPECALPIIF
jgi:hypothetical protein